MTEATEQTRKRTGESSREQGPGRGPLASVSCCLSCPSVRPSDSIPRALQAAWSSDTLRAFTPSLAITCGKRQNKQTNRQKEWHQVLWFQFCLILPFPQVRGKAESASFPTLTPARTATKARRSIKPGDCRRCSGGGEGNPANRCE